MKILHKLLLLFVLVNYATAQQNVIWEEPSEKDASDFRVALKKENNDSLKMYYSRQLGLYYQEIQRDSALYYFRQQLQLAKQLNQKLWEAEALSRLGYILSLTGDYASSLASLLNAKQMAVDKEIEQNIWRASAFAADKNFHTCRLIVLEGIINHLGILYFFTGYFNEGLSHYFEAKKIAISINDKALLSSIHLNIGEIYLNLGNLDSALIYENKALKFLNQSEWRKYSGYNLYLIGNIYFQKGDYDSAQFNYKESIRTSLEQQSYGLLGYPYISLANLYLKKENQDSSLSYALKGLSVLKSTKSADAIPPAYEVLSDIYKMKNEIDSAFFYLKLAMDAKDSLYNAEKVKLFQNIGFNEQIKIKELEKERLENRNKLKSYLLRSGIILFVIITFFLIRINRNKQKSNKILQKKNEEIEEQGNIILAENMRKSKELEDARQMQLAILPKEMPVSPYFDIAVYMKTATEVGGDYYDFAMHEDGSLNICLGDATGHGMKAGIMVSSMKSIFTTNAPKMDIEQFFETANAGIKSMNLMRMMMGLVMVHVNSKSFRLINAGMPPVFFYSSKSGSIQEIKEHGLPVGAMRLSNYKVVEGSLRKGDVLLLVSDGMPELTNTKNEMFGYNRLLQTFNTVAGKKPQEIIDHLKTVAANWADSKDPDDDVTFVVIKVK
ncbi:MAG: SpoIIE family protein phosphatase [Calditrichaeota bacterium]|nr:SpoIIE family protein phosphatase [Calditrichota bacterium]